MDAGGAAQLPFVLGRLLGEDVALERLRALDAAARRTRKRFLAPDLVFIFGMMPFLYLLPTAVLSGLGARETFSAGAGPASGLFG